MGDTETAMALIFDCTLYRPFIIKEYIDDRIIESGQYYTGAASYSCGGFNTPTLCSGVVDFL